MLNDHVEKERDTRTVLGVFGIVAVVTATAQPRCTGNSRWQSRQEQQELGGRRPGSSRDEVGEIKIRAPVIGRISEVPVNANDKVLAGEPLLRLDDEEARARIAMAQAQVTMRAGT